MAFQGVHPTFVALKAGVQYTLYEVITIEITSLSFLSFSVSARCLGATPCSRQVHPFLKNMFLLSVALLILLLLQDVFLPAPNPLSLLPPLHCSAALLGVRS